MKDLQQKVAYLQGLSDGLELDDSREGKVIGEMLKVLEDVAEQLAFLQGQQEDLEDYLESIDSDLADLEDDVYGEEDDEDEDDGMVDVECPVCQEQVCCDEAILYDEDVIEVTCPSCGAVVFTNDSGLEPCECECDDCADECHKDGHEIRE